MPAELAFADQGARNFAPLMRRRLARIFVTLATLVVAWLVTSPAAAATSRAPVCDPRGAIGFAPHPQIQDVEQSLDIVTNDDDCTQAPLALRLATRDRAPMFDGWNAVDWASPVAALPLLRDAGDPIHAPRATRTRARPGISLSIERPPRG